MFTAASAGKFCIQNQIYLVLGLFYQAHRYAIFLCSLDVEILIIITNSQSQYKDYLVENCYLANNQNFVKFVISGQINQSQKW